MTAPTRDVTAPQRSARDRTAAISEVLAGAWVAVLADGDGYTSTLDDILGNDVPAYVAVVRGSAAPFDDGSGGGCLRLASVYRVADVLYEHDDLDDPDEVEMRWRQAQAVAAALNAADVKSEV